MSSFLYGLEMWGSAYQVKYLDRIDTFFRRAYHFGYTNKISLISDVIRIGTMIFLTESQVTPAMYYMTCSHPNVTELSEKGPMTSYSLK